MTAPARWGEKWDRRFMLLAHDIAEWSKESGCRVGAVIIGPDKEIRSTGFNGFPRGVNDDVSERHSRSTGAKYIWSSHAERNAIIQAGLSHVVAYAQEESDDKWSKEFVIAREMFDEAGVDVVFIDKLKELPQGKQE